MTQTKVKPAFAAIVAGLILVPLAWQEIMIARLRTEHRALAARTAPLEEAGKGLPPTAAPPGAGEQAEQTARDRADLRRLRDEVASLQSQLQQAQEARQSAAAAAVLVERSSATRQPGFVSMPDAQDVGAVTGEALFQTFIWALRTGNTNRIVELVDWSAEGANAQLEEMLRELPKSVARGEFENDARKKGFRPVRQVQLPDGDNAMVLDMNEAPNNSHRIAVRIRPAGNEWRIVMGKSGPEEVHLSDELMGD